MTKTLLTTIALLSILTGCSSEPPPYREGRAEAYGPPQVQITGLDAENLHLSTVIDRPITHRDQADLLFITVPVRNTSDRVLHVQYRYNFIDKNGEPILPENIAWNRKTLEPGSTERITFNSTNPLANDFQMDLRYAR